MNQHLNFNLEPDERFETIKDQTKLESPETTIFGTHIFLVGDIFKFPPKEQIKIYLEPKFKGKFSVPVANIARNDKVGWRPIRAFCKFCAKDPSGFYAKCLEINPNSCNREFIESGDIIKLMENFAGAEVEVVAIIRGMKPDKFIYEGDKFKVESYKETNLPVFARIK